MFIRMPLSTVSILAVLNNYLPEERFPLIYDLNDFKSRFNSHHLYLDRLSTTFPLSFWSFFLVFLVTPYVVSAVQLYMEWNPVKKGSSNTTKNIFKTKVGKCTSHLIYVKFIITIYTKTSKEPFWNLKV